MTKTIAVPVEMLNRLIDIATDGVQVTRMESWSEKQREECNANDDFIQTVMELVEKEKDNVEPSTNASD